MHKFQLLLLLIATIAFSSCDNERLFEKNESLDAQFWHKDSTKLFQVAVSDRTIPYSVYFNIRNSSNYPYNNIYSQYIISDTTGNLLLDTLISNDLYVKKTGKPLGESGIGDVYDHQFLVKNNFLFPKKGTYLFELKQYMRTDTLPGVLSVGVRVEKPRTASN